MNGRLQQQQSQLQATTPVSEEPVKQEEEQDKMLDDGDHQMEDGDDDGQRDELQPLTKEEQVSLAANIAALPPAKWRTLTKKLGFADDEVRLGNVTITNFNFKKNEIFRNLPI